MTRERLTRLLAITMMCVMFFLNGMAWGIFIGGKLSEARP